MLFNLPRRTGLIVGAISIAVLLAADLFFVILLLQTDLSIFSALWVGLLLLSLPLVLLMAYRSWGGWQSSYVISPNALTINWGDLHEIVPMGLIEGIVLGRDLEETLLPRGLWWPGCYIGRGNSEGYGPLVFFATAAQENMVVVKVEGGAYIISPDDLDGFVAAFAEAREAGITEEVAYVTQRARVFEWDVWRNRWALALMAAPLLLVLVLFVVVIFQISTGPDLLPLRFDANRQPSEFGPASRLLLLPSLGWVIWLLDAAGGAVLHGRLKQPLAAYLLWGGGMLVQLFLWVAVISLTMAV